MRKVTFVLYETTKLSDLDTTKIPESHNPIETF